MHARTAMIENGFVPSAARAPWLGEYRHELAVLPDGRFDDQVGATAQLLDRFKSARRQDGVCALLPDAVRGPAPFPAAPPDDRPRIVRLRHRAVRAARRGFGVAAIDGDSHPLPTTTNQAGVKGADEAGNVGTSPEVGNALAVALAHRDAGDVGGAVAGNRRRAAQRR